MAESKERSQSRLFVPMSEELETYRVRRLARVIYGDPFELTIVGLIIVNAVVLAVLTLPTIPADTAAVLTRIDTWIYVVFVVEVALRIASYGKKPWRYFHSRWNVFDFLVVALVPIFSSATILLRLLRLLRVIRLFRFMPEFQMLSTALGRTIKPVLSAFMLISLFMFLYAMAGVYIFGEKDPTHWGDIGIALVTLTILLTLENFPETLEAGLADTPLAWIYFVSFMVVVVFTVLNVLIGIVLNAMDEARRASQATETPVNEMSGVIEKLESAAKKGELTPKQRDALRKIIDTTS